MTSSDLTSGDHQGQSQWLNVISGINRSVHTNKYHLGYCCWGTIYNMKKHRILPFFQSKIVKNYGHGNIEIGHMHVFFLYELYRHTGQYRKLLYFLLFTMILNGFKGSWRPMPGSLNELKSLFSRKDRPISLGGGGGSPPPMLKMAFAKWGAIPWVHFWSLLARKLTGIFSHTKPF